MKAEFDVRFLKDIEKIRERNIKNNIERVLSEVAEASTLTEIKQLKKLKGEKNYFRIRSGDYRIGFRLERETLIFERVLHRRDIYRSYPPKK